MKPQYIFIIYLSIINIITFSTFGIDKSKARLGKWRISESSLFILALIGGSIGALSGMFFFHHKTRKITFRIGLPLILVLHIILLCILVF